MRLLYVHVKMFLMMLVAGLVFALAAASISKGYELQKSGLNVMPLPFSLIIGGSK